VRLTHLICLLIFVNLSPRSFLEPQCLFSRFVIHLNFSLAPTIGRGQLDPSPPHLQTTAICVVNPCYTSPRTLFLCKTLLYAVYVWVSLSSCRTAFGSTPHTVVKTSQALNLLHLTNILSPYSLIFLA
jgi:hypothetical protein